MAGLTATTALTTSPTLGLTAAPAVASPSYSVNTDSGVGVRVREGPGTDWPIVGWVGDGDPVTIYCVGYDSAGRIWDHIGPGRYVLDEYVQTGQTTPVTRNCDLPNGGRPSSSQPVDEWTPEDQPKQPSSDPDATPQQTPAPSAGPSQPPEIPQPIAPLPCVDVRFIAVRGSGEDGAPEGSTAKRIYSEVQRLQPEQTSTALSGIDYPAVEMDLEGIAKTVGTLRYHYMESKKAGVLALAAYLDALSSVCPNERWVFLGFSQGAHVLGDAVSSGDAGSLDEAQQAQLAAVVLIADPRFTPQEDFIAGTCEPVRQGLGHLWDAWLGVERGGIAGLRPVGDLSGAAGKIRSWCDAYDPTCQGRRREIRWVRAQRRPIPGRLPRRHHALPDREACMDHHQRRRRRQSVTALRDSLPGLYAQIQHAFGSSAPSQPRAQARSSCLSRHRAFRSRTRPSQFHV